MRIGTDQTDYAPLGLGCWAIGGEFFDQGAPAGWGQVDDKESLRALAAGMEMGVQILDTANIYGAGHSEVLVGKAVKGKRDQIFINTKFGNLFDPATKTVIGEAQTPQDIRQSVEDSLRRLDTDYIDCLLFHCGGYPINRADMVRDTLEELVSEGKIHYYGWSTQDTERMDVFLSGKHCVMTEFRNNVINDDPAMRQYTRQKGLIGCVRSPLAMGLLTGKYERQTRLADDDIRGKNAPAWMRYYRDGKPDPTYFARFQAVREILTEGGRTLAQGCIAWLWGKGDQLLPIPGFRTEKQVRENAGALSFGPLSEKAMAEIDQILYPEA